MAMGSAISSFTLDIDELGWTGQDCSVLSRWSPSRTGPCGPPTAAAGSPASTPMARRRCWAAGVASPTGWLSIPAATWSPPTSPWGGCSG
jgi:hypothetical protein